MSSGDPGSNKNSTLSSGDAGSVAYLDKVLWHQFSEAATVEEFARAWLTLQVSMIHGVSRGVVVLGAADRGPFAPAAVWPESSVMPAALSRAAESALTERRGIVHRPADEDTASNRPSQLAYPLLVDGQMYGVVALEFAGCSERELQSMMRQVQWGCGQLEAFLRRSGSNTTGESNHQSHVLELAATALEHERFKAAATAIVTDLAIQFGCDRVGLGFRRGKHIKVHAVSHSAHFGEQTNLIRAIAAAMDESIDQLQSIVFPSTGSEHLVTQAHAELADIGEAGSICTVIISDGDSMLGALCFERINGQEFDPGTREQLEHIAALLGPILEMKRRDDRLVIAKVLESFRFQLMKIVGPRHYVSKLVAVILLILLVFISSAEGDYRVSAEAVLEGAVQRSMVAPVDGFIDKARVRAGDLVKKNQELFNIDDRDIRLEYLKWSSQKEQVQRRYRDALASKNRSEVNIFKSQLDQANAQLELLQEQISRAHVISPFDGSVVSGDLSQRLGSPVSRGEVLLQIAPLNAYRVVLYVDERNISDIQPGQKGQLILAALPRDQFVFVIEQITPVSEPVEGRNRFRVEATLSDTPALLRPGMEGTGKIMVGQRSLKWIWTHEMVDWIRLWAWYWWP